jgi:hypothetical protein
MVVLNFFVCYVHYLRLSPTTKISNKHGWLHLRHYWSLISFNYILKVGGAAMGKYELALATKRVVGEFGETSKYVIAS